MNIMVHNSLPEATTVHWHGLIVPNQMDGPGDITQKPIQPGETYNYEFTAVQAGTYFYHPHYAPDRQQSLGLYGAIIIDPADPAKELKPDHEYVIRLQEWLKREGLTYTRRCSWKEGSPTISRSKERHIHRRTPSG